MALRKKMINHIRQVTGNNKADLWTLFFNESDADAGIDNISWRGVGGNVKMQEGKLRTRIDVKKDERKALSK